MELKYFKLSEFDSPDAPGTGELMDEETLEMLDHARKLADMPFKINSAYRTAEHNEKVGGKPNSAHTRGYAIDIHVGNGIERMRVVTALLDAGFTRIGIARTFVHADNDPTLPQNVLWTY
jgi:uncharacterized protein YcbK (DUF882 family)